MRKEVILAIVLGLILGTVIVAGYYRANRAVRLQDNTDTTRVTPTPTTIAGSELLAITGPEEGDIFASPIATISGNTSPDARVLIVSEKDQIFLKPSAQGFFSQEVSLIGGANHISITAVSTTGSRADKELNLVFTTELNPADYEKSN